MFRSVRTKILTVAGAVVVTALTLNTLVDVYVFRDQYSRALEAHAITLGRGLDSQLQYLLRLGIPLHELVGFDQQCQEVVRNYKDIAYARVLSLDGTVLFHSEPARHGRQIDSQAILEMLRTGDEAVIHGDAQSAYFDVIVPVSGMEGLPIAAVDIGIHKQAIISQVDRLVSAAVIIGIVAVLLALGVLLVVIDRLVIRPLGRLDRTMQAVGSEKDLDLDLDVDVRSADEFGNIARAFNRMIDVLKASRREIESYARSLESKVEERTSRCKKRTSNFSATFSDAWKQRHACSNSRIMIR